LLLRLGARFGDPYASAAIRQLGPLASMAEENPFGLGQTVLALDTLVRGTVDVVLVGTEAEIAPFRKTALGVMVPGRVLVSVNPADEASVAAAGPLAVGKTGQGVAYVCRGRTCSLPVSAPADLVALMLGKSS
jgi:uncharacterized protein